MIEFLLFVAFIMACAAFDFLHSPEHDTQEWEREVKRRVRSGRRL